jgi:hypothetical protein
VQARIKDELDLLKSRYAKLEYRPEAQWVLIPEYALPPGWNFTTANLAFQIPPQYPGAPPYGIYVPAGIQFSGQRPGSYTEPAPTQPPFEGSWGIFSWTTEDGVWHADAELTKGSNLLNWVVGFRQRFVEGA